MKDYEEVAMRLKELIGDSNFLDIDDGTELYFGVSPTTFLTAIIYLMKEGYPVQAVPVKQVGVDDDRITYINVLCPIGSKENAAFDNKENIITPIAK